MNGLARNVGGAIVDLEWSIITAIQQQKAIQQLPDEKANLRPELVLPSELSDATPSIKIFRANTIVDY